MKLSENPVLSGIFIDRPNRFIARICLEGGECAEAHVPNTGRMQELLVSGAAVRCAFHPSPKRKTAYTLLAVRYEGVWVCVYAAMANAVAEGYMRHCPGIRQLKREVKWGNSRFDLGFEKDGIPALVEVKSANLVTDRCAMFPDAPTDRGTKHLRELMKAQEKGFRTGVLFIVMREDADFFAPNVRTDVVFARHLLECSERGMMIKALRCRVTENEINIDTEIPVLRQTPEMTGGTFERKKTKTTK